MKPRITLEKGVYRGEDVIFLAFNNDFVLTDKIRNLRGASWSGDQQKWYIPEKNFRLNEVFEDLRGFAYLDYSAIRKKPENIRVITKEDAGINKTLTPEASQKLQEYKVWMANKRHSQSTINTYLEGIRAFLAFIYPKPLRSTVNEDLTSYIKSRIIDRKLSFSIQNQVVSSCKLFFREIVKCPFEVDKLERPRRQHRLPNVLSKSEVTAILKSIRNQKHRVMISLIYACGLRRGELLNLRYNDIVIGRGLLVIRQAKGMKDRVVPISWRLIQLVKSYYEAYKPRVWLFEGQQVGSQYSDTSLQTILKKAVMSAGITKPVTLHWLRHSYATHLLESGTDIRFIQKLLGHKSSKTTEIYTHVTTKVLQNIQSPFDSIDI